jgi:adenosine deaminase
MGRESEMTISASNSLAARIPKIHLHCHLEGSLREPTFIELTAKHGLPLRYGPRDGETIDPADAYRFENLPEFLYLFAAVSRSLRDPQDYARLGREFVEDALEQGVIYGELFVSPSVWTFFNPGLDVRATMETLVAELRAARPRATFKLIADVTRNFGERSAMATVSAAAGMADLDVIGISLGGDEARFPGRLFAEVFAYARSHGLHCVTHAGEGDGPWSVRDAVELLQSERIGHGIRALEDAATIELLAARGIALEICPTSNRLTGAALPEHPHPYLDFDRAGCAVTIDADDPALFRTSIGQEYAMVERVAGSDALERYVNNAIDASFASEHEKRSMKARVATAAAELHAAPRS